MSSLTLWRSPLADFDTIARRAFGPGAARSAFGFTPAAEVTRDGSDAVVRLELPGIDVAKDVVVEVVDGRLVVRGERRDERSSSEHGRTVREVRYGSFRRAFALPAHVTGDAITATYDAGVLTVRVADAHAGATGRRIAVTTGAPEAADAASVEAPAESGEQPAA
jgi:HSP20 family protein